MIQPWKIPHIVKGILTFVPVLNAWRSRKASTGGSSSARYCYSVWLRHLVILERHGFKVQGAEVGELGPGDSVGIGLAALLSGAAHYTGLDIVPFSGGTNLTGIFQDLVEMYSRREPIPDHNEFPFVRPALESYKFPDHLIDWTRFESIAERVQRDLKTPASRGEYVRYVCPWNSPSEIAPDSLDLILSQAVLEHVDGLEESYNGMFFWLKPGGYASHTIDFSAHHLSPFWNGHWAYSEREWSLVRGNREFLLNRAPLGTHLFYASKTGFQILLCGRVYDDDGIEVNALAPEFRKLDEEDARTRGGMLILKKPRAHD